VLASLACGVAAGAIIAVMTVKYRADQIVSGLAVNILVVGLTGFLLRTGLGHGQAPVIRLALLPVWTVPVLGDVPVVGPILFQQPVLTFLAMAMIVPLYFMLRHSRPGLLLRAAGENPLAVFAIGSNPQTIRILAVLAGAGFAGLGGAVLVLQQVGTFTETMTGGRGFLALSAIVVGRWMPFGTLAACLVFAAAEALRLRVQGLALPVSSYVVQMLPYIASLLILAGVGRSVRQPAALGVAYNPEDL
jgi:simple sugar transport system permease protein